MRFYRLLLTLLLLIIPVTLATQGTSAQDSDWNGQSRFTVLIMGMDRRPSEEDSLLVRTDVMIVASIDPASQQIGLLDIPRDTHMVPPDAANYVRVNTLFQDGEAISPGYGPLYAMDTLQYNLGMYVDAYVLIDFEAFITLIDALGGIEITIGYPIFDQAFPDMDYGYDPFYLSVGTHVLNGYDALRFARTRHQDNDVLRGSRQLQVIQAVHEKLTDPAAFRDLLGEAPSLLETLRTNVYTDLTIDEMLFLARYALLIPPENIVTGSMDEQYLQRTVLATGRRIDIPDGSRIPELLTNVFGPTYGSG